MTNSRTFHIRLTTKSTFTGSVRATSRAAAVDRACHLWRSECPHTFTQAEDDEIIDVVVRRKRRKRATPAKTNLRKGIS